MNIIRVFIFSLIPILMFQCAENDNPIEEQLKKDKNAINQYVKNNGLQGEYVFNDIYKVLVTPGKDSAKAAVNSGVRVRARMFMLDGTELDSNTVFYQHGQGFVMSGWEAGVSSMTHKEVATFLIPSYYAFGKSTGKKGDITIPPNTIIKLELELVDIIPQSSVPAAYGHFKGLKGKRTSTGLFYAVTDSTNQGDFLKVGQSVTIKYRGYLISGAEFDKSDNFTFVVGTDKMIKGFQEVMPLLKVGQKATVVIPSNLAYEDEAIYKEQVLIIPANGTLVFDMDILEVK